MAGSTWSWLGGSGSGDIPANWTLVAGAGDPSGTPQANDTAIVTNGTVLIGGNPQFVGNTVEIGGTAGAIAAVSFANGATLDLASPALDANSVITSAVPGQTSAETTVLNVSGTFINDGKIIADGPAGSDFTINIQQDVAGSIATPGYFLNSNQMEVDGGNTLTISIGANAAFLNPSLVRVNGGFLDIISNASANAGGYAPVRGTILIENGGTAEINAGTPPGTSGTSPRVAFGSGSGNLLKLDQPGQFAARIDGFAQGDTIDIGKLTVTSAIYSTNGLLTLQNGSVTVATLALWTGGFTAGTYAVSGGVAGSFDFSAAPNGDTLITTGYSNSVWNNSSGSWTTAGSWSTGVVPGVNDTAEIGNGNNTSFTVTTGSSAQTISSLLIGDAHALLQVTNALTVQPQPIEDLAGTLEVTGTGTLAASALLLDSGGAALLMDPGAVLNLAGHSNYGFANAGTIAVPSNNPFAASLSGGGTINGGTLNAGPGQAGGGTGGALILGNTGGGTPTSLLVETAGTTGAKVTDTYSVLSSNPFDYAQLTIDGSKTTWTDAGDPTDTTTTRGYMLVGYNELGGTTPIAGAATLTVSNGATLTEASRAYIGDNANSAGTVTVTSGAVWDVASSKGGVLNVGFQGTGGLTVSNSGTVKVGSTGTFVSNGTTITGGGIGVGYAAGSSGTVTVQSSGVLSDAGGMAVGRGGQGALDVLNGGTVSLSGGSLTIAAGAGSTGTVIVSGTTGGTSRLTLSTATSGIDVGQAGSGTLEVLSGGSLSVQSLAGTINAITLGDSSGATGLLIVSGTNAGVSMGSLTTGLVVGNSGTGEVDILNGGSISLSSALGVEAGVSAGSSGTIKVSGSGASLAAGFPVFGLALGYAGSAQLNILAGGVVTANYLSTGLYSGGTGTVTVSGAGSKLTVQAQSTIGINGTGILNVSSSAIASLSTLVVGGGFGGQGTLEVSSGGRVVVGSDASIAAGSTISVSGTTSGIDIGTSGSYVTGAINLESGHQLSGAGVIASAILNNGQIQSASGTLEVQGSIATSPSNTGSLAIGNNSVLQLDSAVSASQAISFGSGSELILNAPGSVISNAISGLSVGDKIALNLGTNVSISSAVVSGSTVTINASNGTYQLTNVSFAAGTSGQFTSGIDPLTGDNYIQVQPMSYTWIGAGADTNWSTSGNWSGNIVPTGTDAVSFVTNPGTVTGAGSALSITIGNAGTTNAGTWTFNNTTLTVAGQANAPNLPNAIAFYASTTLNGGTLNAVGGITDIGGAGSVTVTAQGGAQVTTEGDSVGNASGQTGTLVLTGSGTKWIEQSGTAVNGTVPGFLTLGNAVGSAGSLAVSNNATLSTGGQATLGNVAGGAGSATVSSGGVWTASGGAVVGNGGSGTLTVNGGTLTTAAISTIGSLAGGNGTVYVTAGGLLSNSGGLNVGGAGTGTLTVDGNSSVTSTGDLNLGASAGGDGVVNVTSATVSLSGGADIGQFGDGTLTIGSGSVLSQGTFAAVGNQAGANGALVVNSGGLFQVGNTAGATTNFYVGNQAGSTGSIEVNAGGTIDFITSGQTASPVMFIGRAGNSGSQSGASGSAMISGAGALLNTNGNALAVGNNAGAQGQLIVQGGGSVAVGSPDDNQMYGLGIANSGGNGAVTVTGAGSTLSSAGYLLDGRGGSGSLTIENNGLVVVTDAAANGGGVGIGFGRGLGPSLPTNYGGSGSALVTTGGTLDVNSTDAGIGVGGNGVNGALTVNSGGTVLAGTGMTVGSATSASGTIYGGTGQLDIGAGGVVMVNNPVSGNYAVVIGNANSSIGGLTSGSATGAASGDALISGAGALLNANNAGVAVGWLSTGSMTISQGGTVESGSQNQTLNEALSIGRRATGNLTITDPGSAYDAQGLVYVGRAGSGSLVIENGGTLISAKNGGGVAGISVGGVGNGGIGQNGTVTYLMTGGNATALLTGGGSMSSQQWIKVGSEGVSGSLTVQNGSTAEAATQIVIGDSVFVANGDTIITPNSAVVSSGSLVTTSGVVNVGPGGTLKSAGAHVQGVPGIALGAGTGSSGTMNVTGTGVPTVLATLPVGAAAAVATPSALVDTGGDSLAVGQYGNGQLVVSQGGGVQAGTQFSTDSAVSLGQQAGATGYIQVTDAGSSLVADGQIDVGQSGNGTLLIQNQATVISGGSTIDPSQGIDIGRYAGGSGNVTVTGAASLLSNAGRFVVGDSGVGSLSIQNAATVTTNPGTAVALAAVIGSQSGSGGSSVSVIGSGSEWQVGGALNVGDGADGALSVASGGTVSVTSLDAGVQNTSSTLGGGVISLSGGKSMLDLTGSLIVGDGGVGELSVLNGAGLSVGGDLTIGNTASGSGNVDIESPTGTVTVGGNLNVGLAGVGVLTIGQNSALTLKGSLKTGANATINQYGAIDPQSLDNSGVFNVNASNDVTYTQYVVNAGTLNIGTGGTNVAYVLETPTITNDGTTDGIVNIGKNHASLTLDSHIFTGQTINFADANGTLVIGYDTLKNYDVTSTNTNQPNPNYLKELIQGFTATINYRAGDQIVVDTTQAASFAYTAGSTDVSVIENGATVGTLSFLIASQASSAYSSGLSDQIYCFAAGTRLRTERGEVAVEALREGDRVWSVLGERFEPVTWIGYRQVTCGRHKRPAQVWPVVVSAGAFGPGLPARDLWLSPDHAVFVNDVLIPVKLLENGTTIRQVAVDSVTYYHVELPAHDVVLAEGLAAESYLDVGDRSSFANGGGPVALHPDFAARRWELRWEAEACAPLYVVGPQVEAARARVAAYADASGRAAA